MSTEQERRRLDALLRDVFAVDEPDPALLARYAEDPDRLAPEARRQLEEQLASSPALRDQLRILQRFDMAALQADPEPAEAGASPGPRISEKLRDFFAPLFAPPVLITAALVLCAVPAGWYLTRPDRQTGGTVELAAAPDFEPPILPQAAAPEAFGGGEHREPVVAEDIAGDSVDRVRDERGAELLANQPTDRLQIAAAPEQAPPALRKPSPAPEPTAKPEPAAKPALAPPPPPEPEIVIAMIDLPALPSYAIPSGAEAEFGRMRTSGRLRSAGPSLPDVTVLVPEHAGRTSQASPDVYWYLAAATDRPIAVTLVDPNGHQTLLEATVPGPHQAGIGRLSLARRGARLPAGRTIVAYVSVVAGASPGAGDRVATGGIERVRPGARLRAELQAAGPAKAAHVYAKHGLWLDAFSAASQQVSSRPGDAAVREQRAVLLDQVGLQSAAQWDRAH